MLENLSENGIDLKKILLVAIGLISFIIILILMFFNGNNGYIIINESLILTKNGRNYKQISKVDNNVLNEKYTVIGDVGTKQNVILNYSNDRFYYMDKNYKDLGFNNVSIAYTKEFKKIKVADYNYNFYDSNDDSYLNEVIENVSLDSIKDSVFKVSYDLDGDGVIETIYTLTNESLDATDSGDYSSIFLVKGDTLIGKLDDDTNEPYMVQKIIDLDGNGKYEVIVSKGTIDQATFNTCYQIYSITGQKIKLIKDC